MTLQTAASTFLPVGATPANGPSWVPVKVNSVITTISTINAAESDSGLLGDLQEVRTFTAWLQAFAFTGLALVLSGIVLALYTISQALRFQHGRIAEMAKRAE